MGLHKENNCEKFKYYINCVNDYINDSQNQECRYEDIRLIDNIAHMEHERWVSSQKLFGYTFGTYNDRIKKQSSYMLSWENLDETIKSYDFKVVETSIIMMCHEVQEIK